MSMRGRIGVATMMLVGVTAGAACDLLLVEPAPPSGGLAVSFSMSGVETGGVLDAFARVDRAYLLLARSDTARRDTVVTVTHGEEGIRVRLALTTDEQIDALAVYAELRAGQVALFKGSKVVRIDLTAPTVAEVPLSPMPALLESSVADLTLQAVGDTAHLSSALLFASGDTIPDVAGVWSSKNPEVVSVTQGGIAVGRAVGATVLEARVEFLGMAFVKSIEARVLSPG